MHKYLFCFLFFASLSTSAQELERYKMQVQTFLLRVKKDWKQSQMDFRRFLHLPDT